MADHRFILVHAPIPSGAFAITARTFRNVNTEALKHDTLLFHSKTTNRLEFTRRLHEHSVGLVQQPSEHRGRVLSPGTVGRVVRVAEVQEWRQKEWHAAPPGQAESTRRRKGVWERERMHSVDRSVEAVRILPHARANGVARAGERLPVSVWDQRKGFEKVASTRKSKRSITMDPNRTIATLSHLQ